MSFYIEDQIYIPVSLREADYERLLIGRFAAILPGWNTAEWKPLLEVPIQGRNVQPDAILVREDLKDWFVVEIELSHHSVSGHIEPQLERLAAASFGTHLVEGVLRVLPGLDPAGVRKLLAHQQPGILCVVDDASERLRTSCRLVGAELMVVAPFRSNLNKLALLEVQRPPVLRIRSQKAFALAVDDRPTGSHFMARLPREFPPTDQVTVIAAGRAHDIAVKTVGGSRVVFVPDNFVLGHGQLVLEPVDPSRNLYRAK